MSILVTDKLPDPMFATVLQMLTALVKQEFEFISREQGDTVLGWLATNRVVNQYYRISVEDAEGLWAEISLNEALQDFVMSITGKFRFYLAEDTWQKLVTNSARSIGIHMLDENKTFRSIMDEEYTSRLVVADEAEMSFNKDPWLLMCYLLSFLNASLFVQIRVSLDMKKKPFVQMMMSENIVLPPPGGGKV